MCNWRRRGGNLLALRPSPARLPGLRRTSSTVPAASTSLKSVIVMCDVYARTFPCASLLAGHVNNFHVKNTVKTSHTYPLYFNSCASNSSEHEDLQVDASWRCPLCPKGYAVRKKVLAHLKGAHGNP